MISRYPPALHFTEHDGEGNYVIAILSRSSDHLPLKSTLNTLSSVLGRLVGELGSFDRYAATYHLDIPISSFDICRSLPNRPGSHLKRLT